jgi:hypothetical protein
MFAGAMGAVSPSKAAEVGAGVAKRVPPGADEVVAQAIQAAMNMAIVASAELMDATIRQHGESPAAALNELQMNVQIQKDSQ